MNEDFDLPVDRYATEVEVKDSDEAWGLDDERYPGSFFRIPSRPPIPGKTVWSIR